MTVVAPTRPRAIQALREPLQAGAVEPSVARHRSVAVFAETDLAGHPHASTRLGEVTARDGERATIELRAP